VTMARAALPGLIALSGLAGTSTGMFSPLIAALLTRAGVDEFGVGLASTLFFAALACVAPVAPACIARFGARSTLATGVLIAALAGAALPWTAGLAAWSALRLAMGAGVALYMVASQTALNQLVDDAHRATSNGLQALAFGVGLGVGPVMGAALDRLSPTLAFAAAGAALGLGLPLALATLPRLGSRCPEARRPVLGRIGLALHASLAYGAAEASLLALYPVYLLHAGADLHAVGIAFAAFVGGSLIATLPLAKLADRAGHGRVIAACGLAAIGSVIGLVGSAPDHVWLWSALCGASIGPVYALALADIGQRLGAAADLASGNSAFTVAFSLGSMLAPVVTGWLMHAFGDAQVFSVTIVLFASLVLHWLIRRPRIAAAPAVRA